MNGVGLGAFAGRSLGESAYDAVGLDWSRRRQAELSDNAQELQRRLLAFAAHHGDELYNNAALGAQFVELLSAAGLDVMAIPLVPARGNPDFLNRLGVRVIELCSKSQGWNGGLLPVAHLVEQLNSQSIDPSPHVSADDVVAAVKMQAELGPGLELVTLPNRQMVVQTIAHELSSEQGDVLAACDALGYVTVSMLVDNFTWMPDRCERVLEQMVSAGLLWIDSQANPTAYWSPGVL